jgi:hypothetical protein
VTGTVTETHSGGSNTSDGGTVTIVNGPTRTPITYTASAKFVVDGTNAAESDFESKISAGDVLTYQQGDAGSSTQESISLTDSFANATKDGCVNPASSVASTSCASGQMRNIHGMGTTYDIVNADGGVIFSGLNYVVPTTSDFGMNSALYFVKSGSGAEVSVTLPQWEQYLNKISGATNPVANITVFGTSAAIEHHLVTDQTVP